ncbi:hypothetical protein A6A04_05525 [Paramagnetospirillum marisnigri]|uniref:Lipoprotein n=2 Tax=Paramagnetospirillum marisnigri TaxID=1285242 RepID=A0A178MDZ4_9PROT|nr:hypothetical protein A6A04_05525 [Paramagnetospirillum marisnigri]
MPLRLSRLAVLAVAAPLALAGCASDFDILNPTKKRTPPPCPPIYILSDAAKITQYRPGPGRDLTDVELEAEIVAFKGECSYTPKGSEVTIQVGFEVKRGPAATSRESTLNYFVAIPKYYPSAAAKAEFSVPVKFPEGMDQARTTDNDVFMLLPIKSKDIINDYEIYIGFQLSPEELEANRRLKR